MKFKQNTIASSQLQSSSLLDYNCVKNKDLAKVMEVTVFQFRSPYWVLP